MPYRMDTDDHIIIQDGEVVEDEQTKRRFRIRIEEVQSRASDQEILTDLLTNLRHWADRQDGVDFEQALDTASSHYEYETADGDAE